MKNAIEKFNQIKLGFVKNYYNNILRVTPADVRTPFEYHLFVKQKKNSF